MPRFREFVSSFKRALASGRGGAGLIGMVLLVGLSFETFAGRGKGMLEHEFVRGAAGLFYGKHPGPADPGMLESLTATLAPQEEYQLMTIRHIPSIDAKDPMPHPYVGLCHQCHLYKGGVGPGAQFKTPVGAMLESMSHIWKLGPPLHPDSSMPHPPAGRCIKCHDIIVKVPAKKKRGGFNWIL
jgi:hypothetical protein